MYMESKDIDPEIQDESMDLKNIDADLVDLRKMGILKLKSYLVSDTTQESWIIYE